MKNTKENHKELILVLNKSINLKYLLVKENQKRVGQFRKGFLRELSKSSTHDKLVGRQYGTNRRLKSGNVRHNVTCKSTRIDKVIKLDIKKPYLSVPVFCTSKQRFNH